MKPKIESLLKQILSGNLKNNNARILNYIQINDRCQIDMMRKDLNIAHQTLTSRISDLEDMGLVYVDGFGLFNDTKYSLYRYENNPLKREFRAEKRRLSKFVAWKKRGYDEFHDLLKDDNNLLQLKLF